MLRKFHSHCAAFATYSLHFITPRKPIGQSRYCIWHRIQAVARDTASAEVLLTGKTAACGNIYGQPLLRHIVQLLLGYGYTTTIEQNISP